MQIKQTFCLFIILIVTFSTSAQSYEKQYEICSQELKTLTNVDSVYFDLVKKRDSCLIGSSAPNFIVSTIDNEVIELSKLKGQVVVLNFWFTRCQPCIMEMPDLNKLVESYSGKKVVFISFAPEDSNTLKDFFSTHPFKFKTVANSEVIRSDHFKLFSAWPYNIVINQDGKISKMVCGSIKEETIPFYQTLIDKLLK